MTDLAERPRLVAALPGWDLPAPLAGPPVVGVLPGEGIGPEVVASALDVLGAVGAAFDIDFDVRFGPATDASQRLTEDVTSFVKSTLAERGAVMCGPVGGRFVYELRAQFDLFCKFSPLRPLPALAGAGVLRPRATRGVDILMVRENVGGAYFGDETAEDDADGVRVVRNRFQYRRDEVERIVAVALAVARARRGKLALVVKPGGLPELTRLWTQVLDRLVDGSGVDTIVLAMDHAAFHVVARAPELDVVVSPNMVGDVLADCGGLLLGSRGMTFSGNFGPDGVAVYQTGHGAAYDLAGQNLANPFGQIAALVLMLRESFALHQAADAVELATEAALAEGWRTADIATATHRSRILGTRDMAAKVAEALQVPDRSPLA